MPRTTRGFDRSARSRHWHETIGRAYFPLDLTFRRPEAFDGELTSWQLDTVSLSRLTSDALLFRRLPRHLAAKGPEEFLVTVPAKSEVRFSQCGKEVRANPGAFILERSDEPYEFSHIDAPKLGPDEVATGCGISVRYPHELLRDTNTTLGRWVRDRRLQAAQEDLANPADARSIVESASNALPATTIPVRAARPCGSVGVMHSINAFVMVVSFPSKAEMVAATLQRGLAVGSRRQRLGHCHLDEARGRVGLKLADQVDVGRDHAAERHVAATRDCVAVEDNGLRPARHLDRTVGIAGIAPRMTVPKRMVRRVPHIVKFGILYRRIEFSDSFRHVADIEAGPLLHRRRRDRPDHPCGDGIEHLAIRRHGGDPAA